MKESYFKLKLNFLFVLALTLSVILLILPPEFTMALYTPNILGYFWLIVFIPITFITFLILTFQDLKKTDAIKVHLNAFCFLHWLFLSA